MKKHFLIALFFLVFYGLAAAMAQEAGESWVHMPAGARPSYMGIHGGTMPISLLVSRDGSSLFTFVGRTGDDFMEILRHTHKLLPSFGNSTNSATAPEKFSTGLFAGNATYSMPVFSLPSEVWAHGGTAGDLEPFGLSDEPLSIEGEVAAPRLTRLARSFRLFRMPDYFQPKRVQQTH